MRLLIACVVLSLTPHKVVAMDPKIDAALKTFKSVAADAARLKTFCSMMKAMDAAGERPTAAAQAQIGDYAKQLGPDFQLAWSMGEKIIENSPEGKAWSTALDALAEKCPE